MKTYTQYKPTNIPWIEDIPEHWKLKKIKYISYVKARVGWKGLTSSDFEVNSDAILITGTDFKGRLINWDSCFQVNRYWYENDPFIQLRENDLLITKDGTIGKIALVNNLPKDATLNSGVFVLRPIKNYFTNEFMYWILSSSIFTNFIKFIKTGSTINHLYQDVLENFQIPLPDLVEQTKIVEYLDIKTKQIDDLILYKENLIDLLEEERTCAINQAVTKGLNPNTQMKDSGIEWLGEIPEHWEVWRIKHSSTIKTGGTPNRSIPEYWEGGEINWMSSGEVNKEFIYDVNGRITVKGYENSNASIIPVNAIMIALNGQGKTKGMVAILKVESTCNQSLAGFIANKNHLHYGFLFYYLKSKYKVLRGLVGDEQREGLSLEILKSLYIGLPPINEQELIFDFLEKQRKNIIDTISKIQKEIELLKEYRVALISEAVTGKIDVRGINE